MDKEVVVFAAIVSVIVIAIAAIIEFSIPLQFVLAAVVLLIILGVFFPAWIEFKEYERGVVFRLGKFNRVVGPGLSLIFTSFESYVLIDLRTQTIDVEPQVVITKDEIKLKIDAVVFIKITDPKKAVIEIKDYRKAITEFIKAEIRNLIGNMILTDVLAQTDVINEKLNTALGKISGKWGVTSERVEIQSIELPPELVEAMRRRKEAVEYKGRTETEAEAIQLKLDIMDRAARKMSDNTLAYLYLDALKAISEGKSNKIIFPLEFSHLASMLSGKIPQGKEEKINYDELIKDFLNNYKEKKKEILEKEEKESEKAK
jgi:regulator of protease activity HflC (stomatin/prohibitin superfamily)